MEEKETGAAISSSGLSVGGGRKKRKKGWGCRDMGSRETGRRRNEEKWTNFVNMYMAFSLFLILTLSLSLALSTENQLISPL